jgi:two-component system, NarL family, nitrate/nitrite response regulator NarL
MSREPKTSVAIVDDHPLTRKGVRAALEESAKFRVVAEGGSASDAIAIAKAHEPDLMLLDINMPGGGVEAAQTIGTMTPAIKLIMLTVYDNMANVRASLQAGAVGYVLKGIDGDEMIAIIQKVLDGAKHLSPELAVKLLMETDTLRRPAGVEAPTSTLTERESQIHALIGKGISNRDIAEQLSLSEATIKQYASQLFKKLKVKNRVEAALLLKN